ncbi:MAG TPA: hypothetical protein PKD31_29715, partial [Blastocatellia bacterium]|nr:hypothetical protein [Blastocatellia bacterium]
MNLPLIHSTRRASARIVCLCLLGLLLTVGGAIVLRGNRTATVRPETTGAQPALRGQQAIDYLKQQGVYDSINQAMRAARYNIAWAARSPLPGGGGAYEAVNAEQNLRAYFTPEGVTVTAHADGSRWRTGLRLRAIGRAGQMAAVGAAEVGTEGRRASLKRNPAAQTTPIEEWYENRADGLEQGFTLAQRPAGNGAEVRLELELTGNLTARLAGSGLDLRAAGAHLRYDGLKSWDATGRTLPTRLELDGRRVRLVVEDADAVYPLTIDPTITQV